jgi:hypothetical protein
MAGYKEFKIEAQHDHTVFRVLVKGWLGIWKSGYIHTDYFSMSYSSEQEAKDAIERYKARFISP